MREGGGIIEVEPFEVRKYLGTVRYIFSYLGFGPSVGSKDSPAKMRPSISEWANTVLFKTREPSWWTDPEEKKVIYKQMQELEIKHEIYQAKDQHRQNTR